MKISTSLYPNKQMWPNSQLIKLKLSSNHENTQIGGTVLEKLKLYVAKNGNKEIEGFKLHNKSAKKVMKMSWICNGVSEIRSL